MGIVLTLLTASALPAFAQGAAGDTTWQTMWSPGAKWLTAGVGYARNAGETAGNGLIGGSVGVNWMWRHQLSLHAFVGEDLYGKFAGAANIGIPIGLTVQRHMAWKTALRPYIGLGGGVVMQRYFRTGDDTNQTAPVFWLVTGADAPIAPGRLLGIVARIGFTTLEEPNPVFNPLEIDPVDGSIAPTWEDTQLWSVQVRYGLAF